MNNAIKFIVYTLLCMLWVSCDSVEDACERHDYDCAYELAEDNLNSALSLSHSKSYMNVDDCRPAFHDQYNINKDAEALQLIEKYDKCVLSILVHEINYCMENGDTSKVTFIIKKRNATNFVPSLKKSFEGNATIVDMLTNL